MLERIKGLAVEDEATYGVDPTIVVADDSIQTRGLTVDPLDGDFITRDLDRAALGAEGDILVASRVLIGAEVEAAGSGTAGLAVPYADMLLSCGFAETLVALVSAAYSPVSASFPSSWMAANTDGMQHIASGARGNMSLSWTTKDIPRFQFNHTGLYNAQADVATPAFDFTNFQVPEAFNNANTPTATLGGIAIGLEAFSIDMQNQIEHRDIIGSEEILLVDRNPRGTITFAATLLATNNWFLDIIARTEQVLQIIHGDTAGNIVTIDCPAVELSNPSFSESQGQLMLTMDMILKATVANNDEITITFT